MKGSTSDVLLIMLTVFTVALIAIVGGVVLQDVVDSTVNQTITITTSDGSTDEVQIVNLTHIQKGQDAMRLYDAMMPFILGGLLITAVVLAFMIPTHPVFIVPAIFSLLLIVIISAQLTNAYNEIATNPTLIDEANNFSNTALIMSNLPLIAVIMGVIIMVAMFISATRPTGFAG